MPQTAKPLAIGAPQLIEWGGGLRWVERRARRVRACARRPSAPAATRRSSAAATRRRGVFHPLKPAIAKIHQRLKAAFDPAGILNPGRMYDEAFETR